MVKDLRRSKIDDAKTKCAAMCEERTRRLAKQSIESKAVIISSKNQKEVNRLDPSKIYPISLIPVNCSFGHISELDESSIILSRMVRKERKLVRKAEVTVLFAIRRPGCGACREHALKLTELAKLDNRVCLVGAIKETNVDNDALLEFYQEYFHYPIYKDSNWDIFNAMGGRKIAPWRLMSSALQMAKRYKKRSIKNVPFGGDIWTQGGVLIFDKKGALRYVYYENYGEELDLDEFHRVIEAISLSGNGKEEGTTSSSRSTDDETTSYEY